MNDHERIWIPEETELVKYLSKQEEDFRNFFSPLTAACQAYHRVSVTGDKCLHSPPDIFCLSPAFTAPPLPLFFFMFLKKVTPSLLNNSSILLLNYSSNSLGFPLKLLTLDILRSMPSIWEMNGCLRC